MTTPHLLDQLQQQMQTALDNQSRAGKVEIPQVLLQCWIELLNTIPRK